MRITSLQIRNFRTLESFDLEFPTFYAAICGKNDSGKTNLVRAMQELFWHEGPYVLQRESEISLKEDYPKWKSGDAASRKISIGVEIFVDKERDAGLHQFIVTQLSLGEGDRSKDLKVNVRTTYTGDKPEEELEVSVGAAKFDDIKAQEVANRLQTSNVVLFHNSVEPSQRFLYARSFGGILSEFSPEYGQLIENTKKNVARRLKRIAKGHQKELEQLLGRLEAKYRVGLSLPTLDLGYAPFGITLGEKHYDVPLDDWGSGTKNRTLILLTLFRARQISESEVSASKVTPVIVIEEPESFLHPSAQALFGRLLQDISQEFQVQVIVTTHSPYMLSMATPSSNILLERKVEKRQLRATRIVGTSGEGWMEPFGLALGVDNREFQPWKELFFSKSDAILLVEGDTDKEYFELLRDPKQGVGQLKFSGEIFPFGGRDTLKNTVLLRFIKNRYKAMFVTFDLDASADVERTLQSLGFEKNVGYLAIGVDAAGKRCIEGLLPDVVTRAVYSAHPELVQAMGGTTGERHSAHQRLKRLLLEEFKAKAVPGEEYYKGFHPLVKLINKAFATD